MAKRKTKESSQDLSSLKRGEKAPRSAVENQPRTSLYWPLIGLFTLSGACGLIYQVVWSRLAVLVFGSTTPAIATVLGVFFLGMALGSYLAGKYVERSPSLLALYGWLEIGIGAYAFILPLLLGWGQDLHAVVFPLTYETPLLLTGLRILIAAAVLLPPTMLMGATVPVIGKLLTRSPRHLGSDFGVVFAFNTFGAAAGSFFGAFFLIPAFGLSTTAWTAALLNLGIGGLSLLWARSSAISATQTAVTPAELPGAKPSGVSSSQARAALAAFAVTGFLGLVYEVAWSRALILVFGTSVYAFATMLTTYLIGMACGSVVMSRMIDRMNNLFGAFIVVKLLIGVSVFASTVAIGQLPGQFTDYFRMDTPWRTIMLIEFAVCFAIMFVPAFGSGMLFPLVTKIFVAERHFRVGKTIADAYAVNTLGCILGSFAAGFVLFPLLGIEMTLLVGASTSLLIAAGLVLLLTNKSKSFRLASAGAIAATAVSAVLLLQTWQPLAMNSGVYIYGEPLAQMEQGLDSFIKANQLLYYREGPSATVAVLESPRGRFLRVNGKTDGGYLKSATSDNYTQSFLGLLPLLYKPDPTQALVVGLGTGMTLEAIHAQPTVAIDCIEISEAVAEAARYFDEANGKVLDSSRVNLRLLDGRTWLAAMPRSYDVIISEPSHPWQTGNANLFTADYAQLTAKRLRPDGVFCQWLPHYQLEKEHFQMLLRTVHQNYAHVNIWMVYSDAIIIASQKPLQIDWPAMQRLIGLPTVSSILRKLDIRSPEELLSFFYLDNAAVKKYIGQGTMINSDDHPIIEYSAPKYLLQRQGGETFYEILDLSMAARLPVINAPSVELLEKVRVHERGRYFQSWGVPRRVFNNLVDAYEKLD